MAEQYENTYTTTLNGGISSGDTSIVVNAAPTTMTGQFRIKIGTEIIFVGSVSGTTFSGCLRGQEGTTAVSHSNGDAVTHVLTADALESIIIPLDNINLHATYGDHYPGPTLDTGKWTRLNVVRGEEFYTPSWVSILPNNTSSYGHYQSFTNKDEFEVRMKASFFSDNKDEGFGPMILNTSNTGVWLGFRNTSRLGIFAVTTGTTGTEPVKNYSYAGSNYGGEGRACWYSLQKKTINSTDYYWARMSFDGATWTRYLDGYAPSAFTPARIGWMQGVQNSAGLERYIGLDWFNVINAYSYGNDLMTTPSSGTATASSDATSQSGAASLVIDGNWGNEWYFPNTNAADKYWKVDFSVAQTMNRLHIKVRGDPFGIATVEFQDGSTYDINLSTASGIYHLEFPTKTTNLVKIYWRKQGHGANPGFAEIAAYLAS